MRSRLQSGTIYEIDTEKFAVARHVKVGPSISMRMCERIAVGSRAAYSDRSPSRVVPRIGPIATCR